MKLYLDDYRRPPPGWKLAQNYKECVFLLGTEEFDEVSLDYSLGERFTGLDVLRWMAANGRFPPKLNIHSSHSFGRAAMADFIRSHFPAGYDFTMRML